MERTYTTVDKADWGAGPWQDEPDKVQWKDEATGLPCLARRHERYGHWCGYVGVGEGHPHFGENYNAPDVSVHGGLTYADRCQGGQEAEAICHVPEPGEPDNVWWFGFDCHHAGDIGPGLEADHRQRYEETGDSFWLELFPQGSYKTLDYVRAEATKLALQLGSFAPRGNRFTASGKRVPLQLT